ncbi:zinc finger protein 285-like isoform X1 [Antennarius striatus]|uniref:zinc finger protein 285-like isoform X1 n=1 Tax=Antennarius striatus TaxID=241820 RepID=UPI0035B23BC3
MSSVQYLKDVINVRLTTAAQEIFEAFKKCVHEYEVEIDRQRRLLDSVLKPEIKLDRIDSSQRHCFKENELLVVQKFCSKERNKNNKDQTPDSNPDKSPRAAQKKSFVHKLAVSSAVPEQQQRQPLSNIRHVTESQDQKGGKHFGSPRDAESKPGHKGKRRVKIYKLVTSKRSTMELKEKMDPPCRLLDATTQKPEVKLDEIERPNQRFCTEEALTDWQFHHKEKNSAMDHESLQEENREKEAFTCLGGEKLVIKEEKDAFMLTPTCEKYENSKDPTLDLNPDETPTAAQKKSVVNKQGISVVGAPDSDLHPANNSHVMESQNQTDETCEQDLQFDPKSEIIKNTHDQPYICSTCGKNFKKVCYLRVHRRTHTAEKRFVCPKCGESFGARHLLKVHMKKVKCENSDNLMYFYSRQFWIDQFT